MALNSCFSPRDINSTNHNYSQTKKGPIIKKVTEEVILNNYVWNDLCIA